MQGKAIEGKEINVSIAQQKTKSRGDYTPKRYNGHGSHDGHHHRNSGNNRRHSSGRNAPKFLKFF